MSILNKLAIGALAAFALFRSKKKPVACTAAVVAGAPAAPATIEPVKQARRKPARRRAAARRVKTA